MNAVSPDPFRTRPRISHPEIYILSVWAALSFLLPPSENLLAVVLLSITLRGLQQPIQRIPLYTGLGISACRTTAISFLQGAPRWPQPGEALHQATFILSGLLLFEILLLPSLRDHHLLREIQRAIQNFLPRTFLGNPAPTGTRENLVAPTERLKLLPMALQQISDRISEIMKTFALHALDLAAYAEELAASIQEMTATTDHIGAATTELSSLAITQQTELTAALETTQEMEETGCALQEQAQIAASSARNTGTQASTYGTEASQAGTLLLEISMGTTQTADSVQELIQSSEQISTFVTVLRDIASRTHLLTLNASIEAARTGDHGRGFTVVAEEMRKLSLLSQNAAEKISRANNENTGALHRVLTHSSVALRSVQNVDQVVQRSQDALGNVLDELEREASLLEMVASATADQTSVMKRTTQRIETAHHRARDVEQRALSVAAAIEEQTASMQELSVMSQSLASTAQQLHHLTQQRPTDSEKAALCHPSSHGM